MTSCINSQSYFLNIDDSGKKIFGLLGSGEVLFSLLSLYEFAIQIESAEYSGLITSDFCEKEYACTNNKCCIQYYHSLFSMEIFYSIEDNAIYKALKLTAKKDLTVKFAQTEVSRTSSDLSRGGEGQPIFVNDDAFVSIIFPAAQNYIDNDIIRLEQAPYVSLSKGNTFEFFPIVYGLSKEKGAKNSFLQYILKHRKKTPTGLRIYSDWGAHDELADEAKLDECMALRLVDNLRKAKSQGVEFDYYLMDAQWFEESGVYKEFKKWAWPQGPNRFLQELQGLGIQFGLWYDVNLGMLEIPEGHVRYDKSDKRTCFGYKENSDLLFDGIREQIDKCGCTMIKLDFAFFDCQDSEHTVHASEKIRAKEPAIRNFLEGLSDLYAKTPNLIVLGYNGFTTDLKYLASVDSGHTGYMISPWWCLYMDYLYCGDPRPSEITTENMGKSLIYYTDSMINGFAESLMPYSTIDDHGTMIGNTNTIYYLGKGNYRDSWVMNISRGSKRTLLYGELELLQVEDWQFVNQSQEMFRFICQEDVCTEPILGRAEKGQPYGYSNSNGKKGYITLVNPGNTDVVTALNLAEWNHYDKIAIRKYYSEEKFLNSDFEQMSGVFSVKLAPNEIVVYQWEGIMHEKIKNEGYLILDKDGCEKLTLSKGCKGFFLRLTDECLSPLRLYGRKEAPIKLQCLNTAVSVEQTYGNPIWSGCSWAEYTLTENIEKTEDIIVSLCNCSGRCLYLKWCEK